MYFDDRTHAGKLLSSRLKMLAGPDTVVIGLPRGGVPVAYEVAQALNAPLDILVTKKLGARGNPEFAMGAITEDGDTWLNPEAIRALAPSQAELEEVTGKATRELKRQVALFRPEGARIGLAGKRVILVDDGLATGATVLAAIETLRKKRAGAVIVALPVASREGAAAVRAAADEVICLLEPDEFYAVGQWYENFSQTSDDEVVRLLSARRKNPEHRAVGVIEGNLILPGELTTPRNLRGWVIFAHGSGSSRLSPRNAKVARYLNRRGFGTLLFDLLTAEEAEDRANVFDIPLLGYRLALATRWLRRQPEHQGLPIAYFGASTGAAAALNAAANHEKEVQAIVSRGGRPDLAGIAFAKLRVPTLFLVGGEDEPILSLNHQVAGLMPNAKFIIVPGAGHLFEEKGTLDRAMELAGNWLEKCLAKGGSLRPEVA